VTAVIAEAEWNSYEPTHSQGTIPYLLKL